MVWRVASLAVLNLRAVSAMRHSVIAVYPALVGLWEDGVKVKIDRNSDTV